MGANGLARFPATGWCVRPGVWNAHYLVRRGRAVVSLCGLVRRPDDYAPQRLRPLQADKPCCELCERRLKRSAWPWRPPLDAA